MMTTEELRQRLVKLVSRKNLKVANLKDCLEIEDWHGVMDASADIREIIKEMQTINDFLTLAKLEDSCTL